MKKELYLFTQNVGQVGKKVQAIKLNIPDKKVLS